jgi:DNA-binding LacI/PurR family transcriptional regulator
VLHSVRSPDDLTGKIQTLLKQKRVDGIILVTPPKLDDTLWAIAPDMPIVVVDSLHLQDRYPTLVIDDARGGTLAVEYLIAKGHRDIGFVGDELESVFGVTSNKYRYDSFRAVLRAHGIPERPAWYRFGPLGSETAQQQAYEVLSQDQRPTAIFASSDVKAFNVMNVAQGLGLRVPDDLAVMGYDDIEAAHYMNLTTVSQHLHATGELAARLLLRWLQDDVMPDPLVHLCSVDIVARGTV